MSCSLTSFGVSRSSKSKSGTRVRYARRKQFQQALGSIAPKARISFEQHRCNGSTNFDGSTSRHKLHRVTGLTSTEHNNASNPFGAIVFGGAGDGHGVFEDLATGRQFLTDQVFDALPNARIAFNLDVVRMIPGCTRDNPDKTPGFSCNPSEVARIWGCEASAA